MHVAVLLFRVNQQAIHYNSLSVQCYWFGHTVSKSLQRKLGARRQTRVAHNDLKACTETNLNTYPEFYVRPYA
jgi:hypothetical protein